MQGGLDLFGRRVRLGVPSDVVVVTGQPIGAFSSSRKRSSAVVRCHEPPLSGGERVGVQPSLGVRGASLIAAFAAASAAPKRRRSAAPVPRRRRRPRRVPRSRRAAPSPAPAGRRRTAGERQIFSLARPDQRGQPLQRTTAGISPARTSVKPSLALSPLTRQSAASASDSPLPRAWPVIAATVGFGIAATASAAS